MKSKIIACIGFAALLAVLALPIFQKYDYESLDLFRQNQAAHPDIIILAIDSKSLQSLGRWPWDRNIEASIVDKLNLAHARAIAIDINFSETQDAANDSALALSLRNSKAPIVLPAEPVYMNNAELPSSFLLPIPKFADLSSVSLGHTHVSLGPDRQASVLPEQIGPYQPFTRVLAEKINADPGGRGLINFAGPAGSILTYSASDFLSGKIDPSIFSDKIVFLGATASDLHDVVQQTPVGIISGVEWHANVFNNLLTQNYIRVVPSVYVWVLRIILGLLLIYILPRSSNKQGFVVLVLFLAAAMLLSFGFWQTRLAFPYLLTVVSLLGIYIVRSFYKLYQTEMEKRRIRQNFKNYFSPQVLDMVMRHPDELKLGGERVEATVLFSDIRSFTTISESMDPEMLSSVLAEYFTEMTAEILATDGVLDKFIGDAIMAFWGAPIPQPDQADRAVKAALGMMRRLQTLNGSLEKRGLPKIDIGIGINSGSVIVGNMGSKERFDYTVIGDAVNTASRLESLNKEYKSNIIISEAVKSKVSIAVQTEELGSVLVKGKSKETKIYKLRI